MATQTIDRTTDLSTGVEFTFTPENAADALMLAATGTVNVSSASPDAQGAVYVDLVYGALVGGVQKATMILTPAQITTLGTSVTESSLGLLNHLVEVFNSDGATLLTGSNQTIITANVAPAFTINSVLGRDNKFVITATHTNANGYTVLNEDASAFRGMFSRSTATDQASTQNAGYIDIAVGGVVKTAGVGGAGDSYVLTTVADAAKLPNNFENDIWVQGTSTLAFGAHRTNLAGVNGFKATPNNLPDQPTGLAITTKLDGANPDAINPVTFSGDWSDDNVYDTMSYKYGRLNDDGTAFLGASTSVETTGAPSANDVGTALGVAFSFPIPLTWFELADNSDNNILIGMTVTQNSNTGTATQESRTSDIVSVIAYNPTPPSIVLSANPAVNNATGAQTFTVTTSGIHLTLDAFTLVNPACPLIAQYKNGAGDWTPVADAALGPLPATGIPLTTVNDETKNLPGTATGTFALAYANIADNAVLQVRVSQADPNGGDTLTVSGSGDFTLLQYKDPVPQALLLAPSGVVGTAPTASQAGAALNGYTHFASTLTAYNGYDSNAAINGNQTRTLRHTSTNLNITGGQLCSGSYQPGANCRASITNTYTLATPTGYTTIGPFTDTKESADNILYYEKATINTNGISINGSTMIIEGDTNGASFDADALTGYALTNMDAAGDHFTKITGNVAVAESATFIAVQGVYNFTTVLTFPSALITSAPGFQGLVHLDAKNAPSDLQLLA